MCEQDQTENLQKSEELNTNGDTFTLCLFFFCTGIKKLEKCVYEKHVETFFGYQPVVSLQLCSMTAPKDKKTGYYKIMHKVQLETAQKV